MDLQKKFDIAVKLLERRICMDNIIFCSAEELASIAQRRLFISPTDLEAFAEEVAHRSHRQAQDKQRQRDQRSKHTILVTDDQSCMTNEMRELESITEDLSEQVSLLDSGFQVVFRIRDKGLAQYCSKILDRKMEATNEPLPSLKNGDHVMILPQWQLNKWFDPRVAVELFSYIPESD